MNTRSFFARKPALVALLGLLLLGSLAAYLKLQFLGTTHSGDYDNYVMTAQYLSGESVDAPVISIAGRLLKPLYPAYLSLVGERIGFDAAAIVQSVFFYLLFVVAIYLLAREFFEDAFPAVLVVILSAFSYPVLKYGLDVYSETGAWFFYVLSLWLTLRFIKFPSRSLFLWNALVITLGFLWKEYIVVAAIAFGLALLFHPALSVRMKSACILAYAGIFLAVHIPWQLHVFRLFDFSYLDWYLEAGADGFSYEFTLKNILKSTAALLGVMWLLVPRGFQQLRAMPASQRMFAYLCTPVPLIGYAWGFISSRLLFVIAPPFLLIAVLGMRAWARRYQIAIVALAAAANITWLILSYRVSL